MKHGLCRLDEIGAFDTLIDVRSPAEFAEDHLPGALSAPVLDDHERAEVGTLHAQESPFAARRLGAALVAANIGRHLRHAFMDKPKSWRPLVYCWRGGMRSGAMTTLLRAVGWNAGQLEGGYKAYRQEVLDRLARLPGQFRFIVLGGATGNAKTRILQALEEHGAQILDLETLAGHKGSVLGLAPGALQPGQKAFETRLCARLAALDPARPVFVEAESRKIGKCHLPETLVHAIRQAPCRIIEAPLRARIDFLLDDYAYFTADPASLKERIDALKGLQSNDTLAAWNTLIDQKNWRELVKELLTRHYDPLYRRSQARDYAGMRDARLLPIDQFSPQSIAALAGKLKQETF